MLSVMPQCPTLHPTLKSVALPDICFWPKLHLYDKRLPGTKIEREICEI
jgi:hypothetical protein